MCARTSKVFEILITAGATTNAASEGLRVELLLKRGEELYIAALNDHLDELKELIAGGADPNGFKNEVRVIAEASCAPPHPLCGHVPPRISRSDVGRIVELAATCVVWICASSSHRRPNRPPRPPSSSESAVVAAQIVKTGHIRSRVTPPHPSRRPGPGGRGMGARERWRGRRRVTSVGAARARTNHHRRRCAMTP